MNIRTTFYFFSLFLWMYLPSCEQIPEEKDGKLHVEAEDFIKQSKDSIRAWYEISLEDSSALKGTIFGNHAFGASNGRYLKILPYTRITHDDSLKPGENFSEKAGELAVLHYKVKINEAGRYYVWVRAYSEGTEDNGLHVGLNGAWPESGKRMQWCEGKSNWTWASKQRTEENHCGEPELIYLDIPEPGVHEIQFSMREDGFEFDQWVLSKEYSFNVAK